MKIIAANWKMNHGFDEADTWLDGFFKHLTSSYEQIKKNEIILCPPFIMLDYIDSELMEDGFEHLEEVMRSQQKQFEDLKGDGFGKKKTVKTPLFKVNIREK